jgi:decaprenylphospho-beta-D-erythro-pentofuranosid-2-ulose 2-reductase
MAVRFQRAVVVGASSGIGEALARRLAAEGARVALVARRREELLRVQSEIQKAGGKADLYVHDVIEMQAAPALFERIRAELGGIDLLIYAAGFQGGFEEGAYDFAEDRRTIEVNLLGAMAWGNLAAARFEAQRGGTLVGISSVAGDRGRRRIAAYSTSKAALNTYLEALRNRVGRYGVHVVTIKPGFVDTAMTRGRSGLFWLISADQAATRILAQARRGVTAAYVPRQWRVLMAVLRSIPSFIFRQLNI